MELYKVESFPAHARVERMHRKTPRRQLTTEALEQRQCLAASLGWDGPGQGSADLNYYIGNGPDGLAQEVFETTIERALDVWSDVIDVNFTRTSLPNQLDSLDFTSQRLDGANGTLAQAYFPDDLNPARIAGDIQFDTSEDWEVGNAQGRGAFDLMQVAVHEIGHALGIEHLEHSGSVLAPFVSASQQFTSLSSHDIDAALAIYAREPGSAGLDDDSHSHDDLHGDISEPSSSDDFSQPETIGEEDTEASNPNFRPWQRHWRLGDVWLRIGGRMIATENQHNAVSPADVNQDGLVTARDALSLINFMVNPDADSTDLLVDANNDGYVSPTDALFVINEFTRIRLGTPTPGILTSFESAEPEADAGSLDESSTDGDLADADREDTDQDLTDDSSNGEAGEQQDTNDDMTTDDPANDEASLEEDSEYRPGLGWGIERLFEIADDNDDGQVTEDEVSSHLWNRISVVDANANGGITLEEIDEYLPSRGERHFNRLDANEDGFITADEVSDSIWERLSSADANDDGQISQEELTEYAESRPSAVFRHLDDNDDGQITEDEVGSFAWRFLVMLDVDDSGSITPDESPINRSGFRSTVESFFQGFRYFSW